MSMGPYVRVWDSCISCSPLRQDFLQFWFALPGQSTTEVCTILTGSAYTVYMSLSDSLAFVSRLLQPPGLQTLQRQFQPVRFRTKLSHLLGASVQSTPSRAHVRLLPAFPAWLACVSKALSAWKCEKAAARWVQQCRLVLHLLQIFLQNQSLQQDVDACGCSILHQKIKGTWGAFCNLHIQAWPPDHPLVVRAADLSDLKPHCGCIKHSVWQQQSNESQKEQQIAILSHPQKAKAYASFCRPCLAVVGALAGALAGPLPGPEGELGIQDRLDFIAKTWLPLPLKNAFQWNYSEFQLWVAGCFSPRSCRIRFLLQICRARCAPTNVQSVQLAVWDQEWSTLLHRTTGSSSWRGLHVHSFSRSAVFARRQHLVMSGGQPASSQLEIEMSQVW